MTHARRTASTAALASVVAVIAGALVGFAPAASAVGLPDPPRIAWSSCGDGFQCADVPVPLDYDRPSDGTITVALLRQPAAESAKRKGSLFIDPGGPGVSGVGSVRSTGKAYPQEVRDTYDLVGFDPRGVGDSTPLRCFDDEEDALAAQHQQKFPITAAEVAEWQRVDRVFADACAAHGGPILGHMSTANVARDLDLLRRAVGDARLNYLGYSYGSYIGMTYVNMFPTTVGAFVIDGVLDPIAWSTGNGATARTQPFTTRIRSDQGSEDTLDQFLTLCDQAGDRCALSGNARARYEALLERAKVNPIPYPGFPQITLGYAAIIGVTLSGMYGPRWSSTAWPARDTDRYTGPWRATTSNPVLVVGNYYDPSTPYETAVTASRLLKNARLLSYAGWGHKAYLTVGNTCIDDAVTRYLVANTLPARGTVCLPQGTPFDAPGDVSLPIPPQTPAF